MTRREYALLAEAMKFSHPAHPRFRYSIEREAIAYIDWLECLLQLVVSLSIANPQFDSVKFRAACYPETEN